MNISIIVTGGTVDKDYDEVAGQLSFKETHVKQMLRLGRSNVNVNIVELMMIDSLNMTDKDRNRIAANCRSLAAERIVVTHGTDTMVETAEVLAKNVKNKTIVLTGAMIPYTFQSSDGLFNIGNAMAFVQMLPHGVYVAMNGRIFNWYNVKKNRQNGVFEELT